MSSSRLPGKVLAPLAGAPAIVRMMERVERVTLAEQHVIATSEDPTDDPIVAACLDHDIPFARGPLSDVLGRVVTAVPSECGVVVRLTGDCPLMDPALVDHHIERYTREQPWAQYVTNVVIRTFPDGLDVEVVSRALLAEAHRSATTAADREHVTPWVQRRARLVSVTQEVDLSGLRWTLDTPADYDCVAAIYDTLYPQNPCFDSRAVYQLLVSRPELIRLMDDAQSPVNWVERIREHLATGAAS